MRIVLDAWRGTLAEFEYLLALILHDHQWAVIRHMGEIAFVEKIQGSRGKDAGSSVSIAIMWQFICRRFPMTSSPLGLLVSRVVHKSGSIVDLHSRFATGHCRYSRLYACLREILHGREKERESFESLAHLGDPAKFNRIKLLCLLQNALRIGKSRLSHLPLLLQVTSFRTPPLPRFSRRAVKRRCLNC